MRNRRVLGIVASAFLAGSVLLNPISAMATEEWQYTTMEEGCDPTNPSDNDTAKTTAENQADPTATGGWTVVGSERYNTAKTVFETLTNSYGFSGAAAAGVIGNLDAESGMNHLAAENSTSFDLHSKEAPAGAYGTTSGSSFGGGLFQFTPYQKFTNSKFWSYPNSDGGGGWYPENQVAYVMGEGESGEFSSGSFMTYYNAYCSHFGGTKHISSLAEFYSETDPQQAAEDFFYGYERGAMAYAHMDRRKSAAQAAYVLFGGANVSADPSKWVGPGTSGGADISIASAKTDAPDANSCAAVKSGTTNDGKYLTLAKQFAGDKSIGYSQPTRYHNPNMDCSSFVWFCLTETGNPKLSKEVLGGSPFSTYVMGPILQRAGFTRIAYSEDALQPGDILLNPQSHTEIFLGWYDYTKLDSSGNPTPCDKSDPNAKAVAIGAHHSETHGIDGAPGDQDQEREGDWGTWGQEVGAGGLMHWEEIWRPSPDLLAA